MRGLRRRGRGCCVWWLLGGEGYVSRGIGGINGRGGWVGGCVCILWIAMLSLGMGIHACVPRCHVSAEKGELESV